MIKRLGVVMLAVWLSGCGDQPSREQGNFKDPAIRHQLTSLLSDVSLEARDAASTQAMLAQMDALISVESPKCSATQVHLLRQARGHLQDAQDAWRAYRVHAARDSDSSADRHPGSDEDRKAQKAAADCAIAVEQAKQTLTAAAASF